MPFLDLFEMEFPLRTPRIWGLVEEFIGIFIIALFSNIKVLVYLLRRNCGFAASNMQQTPKNA